MLFSTTAGAGHFGPMIPIAHACADAGHAVAVAAPASFAGSVAKADLAPYRSGRRRSADKLKRCRMAAGYQMWGLLFHQSTTCSGNTSLT